jgi:NAD(P)H-dependent flavin oxidoreductase YrpB (nitropropane dioxygenase family)
MFATALVPIPVLETIVEAASAEANGPIGINVLLPFLDEAVIEAIAPRVRLVDFYYGAPDAALVKRVHACGALAGWQVGTLEDAKAAVDVGCDLIVVRGTEGGGRMFGVRALWPLLEEVLEAVQVPVLAAGGIGTGRGLAAALAAGAAGVRMGTRFLATVESGAHAVWKEAAIRARAEDAILTTAFSVLWPNGPEPHRVLRSAVTAATESRSDIVGQVPMPDGPFAIPRFGAIPPGRKTTGDVQAMALYAGESVHAVASSERAGDVVNLVTSQAEDLLSKAATIRQPR